MPSKRTKAREVIPMTLAPEKVTELLKSETEALKVLKKALPKGGVRPLQKTEQFVERCYLLHRNLIHRWGGWAFQGTEFLVDDPLILRDMAAREWTRFTNAFQQAIRSGDFENWNIAANAFSIGGANYQITPGVLLSSKTLQPLYGFPVGGGARIAYEHVNKGSDIPVGLCSKTRPSKNAEERAYYGPTRNEPVTFSVRVGERISSAVMEALKKHAAPEGVLKLFEQLFQRLGEKVWASQQIPVRCEITCAPSAFLRLGNYGENSCYANGGGQERSKYWLASDCADSFVVRFYRPTKSKLTSFRLAVAEPNTQTLEVVDPNSVSGRAWGVATPGRGAVVSNFYMLPIQMVLPALTDTLAKALDVPNITLAEKESALNAMRAMLSDNVYSNGDAVAFTPPENPKFKLFEQHLEAVLKLGKSFGFFGNSGKGPQFLKHGENGWSLIPPRGVDELLPLWPYPDTPLERLLFDAVTKDGTFNPLTGPVFADEG